MDNITNNPNVENTQESVNTHVQEADLEEIEDMDLLTALISELEDDEISVTINNANAASPLVEEEGLEGVDIDATDEEDHDDDNQDDSADFHVDFF